MYVDGYYLTSSPPTRQSAELPVACAGWCCCARPRRRRSFEATPTPSARAWTTSIPTTSLTTSDELSIQNA
eukprot:2786958-Pleurochrysis_carterae.AAC.1